ncbi:ribosomal RNA processing protein 1 homolog B-like isoform X2 [Hemibagrus wyckioides]|uniref:ribosomal RNA processing protein 1 homolog B-like isoform X2 n=1 Tax=Hemibagrus wyckioides TaxID=337641 RepID=UPI00266D304B|nr:ribosomal RNA processing protein 1 homolog B-like isoform X2 [Hemibagrus wyckioides]
MAPVPQEPEITLAQRLASNEKPIRTKALKTLRKYFNLRSQKIEGGFTSEDLLKIWKGLFYCLWMQDKPLLQEEISHKISSLIHSFHTTDTQLLYFTTFLQTVKREWNGIDRLRMDKFYQLVRFVFRQAFEVLKRREWDASLVNQFLHVFTEQLLQNSENVPKGLMLHILDLYMTELAQVGSTELTAEQNLTFIDPFCKTMAKTKDGLLLLSISKNIFRTILDHAPFAIEDLIRELQQGGGDDSDSGQASGEEEDEIGEEEKLKNRTPKKTKVKKVNGISEVMESRKGNKEEPELDDVGSDEDDGVGPVLQFDYGAVADRLFELGSHLNTRNINRKKMYSLVKAFRNLNEGISDGKEDDNADVSKTSDNKMLKKKSKKKKRKNERSTTGDESLAKKSKACQDERKAIDSLNNNTEDQRVVLRDNSQHHHKLDSRLKASEIEADGESVCQYKESDSQSQLQVAVTVKNKRKSKKAKTGLQDVGGEVAQESDGEHQGNSCKVENCAAQKPGMETGAAECVTSLTQEKTKKKKKLNAGEEKMDTETDGQIQPEVISLQLKTQKTEDTKAKAQLGDPGELDTSAVEKKKKRKNKKLCSGLQDVGGVAAVQTLPKEDSAGDEITLQKADRDNTTTHSQVETSTIQTKKVKRKKSSLKKFGEEFKSLAVLEDSEISVHPCPTSEEDSVTQCALKASSTKKKKGKRLMADGSSSQEVGKEVDSTSQDSSADVRTKKSKKKKATEETGSKQQVDLDVGEPEVSSDSAHITTTTTPKNKGNTAECPQSKLKKTKKKKESSSNEEVSTLEAKEQPAVEAVFPKHTPWKKKKIQNKKESQLADEAGEVSRLTVKEKAGTEAPDTLLSDRTICTPEMKSLTPMKKGKKKRKLQTDEAEMSQSNGHAQEELSGKKVKFSGIEVSTPVTPKKLKMVKASPKSDFVSFQGLIKPPTPLFYKTKPKVSTPLTSIKGKFQTPKSETKKVTFGLKNNKTAEFRKTDRSLLVSPVGSSRVAFDPKKMPVSGVLKSPSPSPVAKKLAAKKRPTAADFF